jgi:hypothetical protein
MIAIAYIYIYNIHVYMYIYVYICIYIYMYMYICIYIYIHIYIYAHTHTHMHMNAYINTHLDGTLALGTGLGSTHNLIEIAILQDRPGQFHTAVFENFRTRIGKGHIRLENTPKNSQSMSEKTYKQGHKNTDGVQQWVRIPCR